MSNQKKAYTVLSSNPKGHQKYITIGSGENTSATLKLHRFALVGKGDQVRLGAAGNSKLFTVPKDASEPDIPVTPIFNTESSIVLGSEQIKVRTRELESAEDLRSLEFLEQFHYKTNASLGEKDTEEDARTEVSSVGGRRAILLAEIRIGQRWIAAGYIDLQMPLMMCKPRHELFAAPYKHPIRSIAWETWDQKAMRSHLNSIVRIARIVVSPDHRGLGITRHVIAAAKKFAAERWQIGGVRPVFMEISAEMLSHIDFVSSSGFKFVGMTEGNLSRVIKDMEHMQKAPGGIFGIMSLQRKYLRALEDYCKTLQITFDDGLKMLKSKIEQQADSVSAGEWAMLRSVVRSPIPYYLCPLDEYSASYLKEALAHLTPGQPRTSKRTDFSVRSVRVNIEHLTIRAAYGIPETRSTRVIMEAFGLKGDTIYSDLVQDVSVKASNGNIILVVGASGSGKSVFLDALDPAKTLEANLQVKGRGDLHYTAGRLRRLRDDIPVFEALAERYTPDRAFVALSRAGLAEALAVIKPFWMLSRGQQYRAMIADLLLRNEEVWLLDEFCSDLDPLTAKIVAHNLRKHVTDAGRIAFVAAANHTHYFDALRPTKVLLLRPGDRPVWLSSREYQDEFLQQAG